MMNTGCVIKTPSGTKKFLKVYTNFSQTMDLATGALGPLKPLAGPINPDLSLMLPCHTDGLTQLGVDFNSNGYGLFQAPSAADGVPGGYDSLLAGRIFLVGGNPADGRMQEYDPVADSWSLSTIHPLHLRTSMPFVFFQETVGIIIMGGGDFHANVLQPSGNFTQGASYSGDEQILCAVMTPSGVVILTKNSTILYDRRSGGGAWNFATLVSSENPTFASMVIGKDGLIYLSLKTANHSLVIRINSAIAERIVLIDGDGSAPVYALKAINNYIHCISANSTRLIEIGGALEAGSYSIFPDSYTQPFSNLDHVLPVVGDDGKERHLIVCHSGNNLAGFRFSLNSKFML
jgi:hypothetical protein